MHIVKDRLQREPWFETVNVNEHQQVKLKNVDVDQLASEQQTNNRDLFPVDNKLTHKGSECRLSHADIENLQTVKQ